MDLIEAVYGRYPLIERGSAGYPFLQLPNHASRRQNRIAIPLVMNL